MATEKTSSLDLSKTDKPANAQTRKRADPQTRRLANAQTRRLAHWGRYALGMSILFYVHYYALFLVAFHGLYVLWLVGGAKWAKRPWRGILFGWGISVFVAGVALLPWLGLSWQFVSRFTGDFVSAAPQTVLWRGLQAFSGGLVANSPRFVVWTVLVMALAALGTWIIWHSKRHSAILLLLYLSLPFLGIMLLSLRGQAFTERYLLAAQPAYLALVAVGLAWLQGSVVAGEQGRGGAGERGSGGAGERGSRGAGGRGSRGEGEQRSREAGKQGESWSSRFAHSPIRLFAHSHIRPFAHSPIRLFAYSLILILMVWGNLQTLYRYHFEGAIAKSPQWRAVFEHIANEQNLSTDALIYNFPEASITYYVDTKPKWANNEDSLLTAFLVPAQPNPTRTAIDEHLSSLLQAYERVWFVPVDSKGWDDDKLIETWLTRHADRIHQANFHWVHTDLYLTPAQIEATMTPQVSYFAEGITLRGFQLFNASDGNQVHLSEGPLDLSLYWLADGPTSAPLTVFVQLIGPKGVLRGGQDNQPVWNTYPTTAWQPGEKITDKYQVFLQDDAPSGDYQIWVGLYNPQTGERVMLLDEAGNVVEDHVVLGVGVVVK